ncbi:MAG: amidohydrolase [Bacteroidales bacterium]|nr:amidohydrolase [Bacteroidales bacterium]
MKKKELIKLRHSLHKEPELSNKEFKTSARMREFLKPTCPDQTLEIGPTGFLLIYEGPKPGPTLVFRAELDALPIREQNEVSYRSRNQGVAHVCGHDGHMAILAGLGQTIADKRPLRGKAVLLFQHAEEVEQGAFDIVENKKFKSLKPDYVFALHNIPGAEMHRIIVRSGTMTAASRGMTVKLTGKSSHAAEPEKGINPAMAISKIIQSLDKLIKNKKQFLEHTLLTVIHIRLGEIAFGTSPGYAEIRCTLRAFRNEDMDKLVMELEKVIQQISLENKLRYDISYTEEFPATENDPGCVEMVTMAAAELDLDVDEPAIPYPWSEDFAYYTREYNGCLFGLGSGIKQPALHNPDYDFPDALIETGVRMFEKIYQKILL